MNELVIAEVPVRASVKKIKKIFNLVNELKGSDINDEGLGFLIIWQ